MKFGVEKCAMKGKLTIAEEISLANQEITKMLKEKENYKLLDILEVVTIKQRTIKVNVVKKYPGRSRKMRVLNFCSRNLIKGIRVISIMRYSGHFLNFTKKNFKNVDDKNKTKQKTTTPITTTKCIKQCSRETMSTYFMWKEKEKEYSLASRIVSTL